MIRVPAAYAEMVGAFLMDPLRAYEEQDQGEMTGLLFYPAPTGGPFPTRQDVLSLLPANPELAAALTVEVMEVPGGWEENWRSFFVAFDIGRLHIRPPWEPAAASPALDVCINPGLAFGTGLHETTRGVLRLLAERGATSAGPGKLASHARPPAAAGSANAAGPGKLVDAGCGSGILSIAAFRLGYRPVLAFDADPLAVEAARANSAANGAEVQVELATVAGADAAWFEGATIVANIAEKPVLELLGRLAGPWLETVLRLETGARSIAGPVRLIAAGLLQGAQEAAVVQRAAETGWRPAGVIREGEWATIDLERVPEAGPGSPEESR